MLKRKVLKRVAFSIILCVIVSFSLHAQQQITGKITDDTGQPLAGATIIIKSSTTGSMSSIDGSYIIQTRNSEDILIFSFIGYETQEIISGNQTIIDVTLKESATQLDDVVVIGYGTVKKDDLTGSIAVISSDDLNRTPSGTFTAAIQGKAPGVLVSRTSGKPGSETSIRVRGVGSISRNSDPIYVIDGVITDNLNSINPADIESLQVLKDASSAAIYGADGANGVIIITTRRGVSGDPKVTYSSYFSQNKIPRKIGLMNAQQYSDFYNTLNEREGISQIAYSDAFRQAYYGEGWENGTDWQDEITTPGYTMNQYLRVSGGSDKSNFSISANYYNESGILVNNNAQRYNFRANSDFKISNKLKVGETFNISRLGYQSGAADFDLVKAASPLMAIYDSENKGGYAGPQQAFEFDANGNGIIENSEFFPSTGGNDKFNPLGMAMIPDNNETVSNFLGSLYAEYEIFDGLTYRIMPSVDFTYGKTRNWLPSYDMGVRTIPQATLTEIFSDILNLSLENQVSYRKTFGYHNLSATYVHHYRKITETLTSPVAVGFPYENLNIFSQASPTGQSISGSIIPFASISHLGRLLYDYKGRYLLTASLRRDSNSRFGSGNRDGIFPSLSAGWKLNEDLFETVDQINMLKVRVGWGKTGNSGIGNFQYDDFLSDLTQFSPIFGIDENIATATYVLSSFANPIVKWEAAEMINVGFDVLLFNNKIQSSLDYYVKNQNDLLVQKPVSHIFGRASEAGYSEDAQPWLNVGKLRNSGFEFQISYREQKANLYYNISANITTIKNEVISIPTDDITDRTGYNRTVEGRPVGSLYGYVAERLVTAADFDEDGEYKYALPTQGVPEPGDIKFSDLNMDGRISDLDRTLIGKPIPDFIYGFNVELAFKNWDFSFFLNGMTNFEIFNAERADLSSFNAQDLDHNKLLDFAENYFKEDRIGTEYVRADPGNANVNNRISTWWIEDGTFLRVNDIQLGYSIPSIILNRINVDKVRFYISLSNPHVFTKYTGRDPEVAVFSDPLSSGTDRGGYPNPRVSTIGVQIDF